MMPPVETVNDVVTPRLLKSLAALLDHDAAPWRPGELPPLGHWLLCPQIARQSAIGADGHPARICDGSAADTFPRRMWAGGRVRLLGPVSIGATVTRTTERIAETMKQGRSGAMCFVTLRHRIAVEGRLAIEEEQDLVYREAAAPGTSNRPPAPTEQVATPAIHRIVTPDPVQLFRFSALTFNGHRIHYDRPYAIEEEGYPALVVHGPYLATLLMDLFLRHRPAAVVTGFSFRALRPIFDTDPFTLALTEDGGGADLLAIDAAGGVAMQARVDRD